MRRGDLKEIWKMGLMVAILGGFLLSTSLQVVATQDVTLGLSGIANVGVGLSSGSGLSINPNLLTPITENLALTWKPSISPNVVGYDIYYGGVSGIYTNEMTIGNVTNIIIPGLLSGTTYYFVVTAVNSSGIQSSDSSQLPYTVSTAPTLGMPVYSSSGFTFPVTGMSGSNCVIQVSTNLFQWVPLQTNTIPFQFTDPNANHFSRRFYRAVYP